MWEYKRIIITYKSINELNDELNKFGEDNWEIISYEEEPNGQYGIKNNVKILLKRKKDE